MNGIGIESLKASVARLISLLEQTLRNASGEGPSNRPVILVQAPTTAQLEERMSEHGQDPQHNPAFVQSAAPTLAPAVYRCIFQRVPQDQVI
jgi:hypothetical protein